MSVAKGKLVTSAVVGAGHRGLLHASCALAHPDKLKIVAVADPNESRRKEVARIHEVPSEMCFDTAEELAARPPAADAVINATMDHQHVTTSLPLLAAGYDILVEKPIATTEADVRQLLAAARKHYIDQGLWSFYAWQDIEHLGRTTAVSGGATTTWWITSRLWSSSTTAPLGRTTWWAARRGPAGPCT